MKRVILLPKNIGTIHENLDMIKKKKKTGIKFNLKEDLKERMVKYFDCYLSGFKFHCSAL